ncbi:MAG: lipocalin-like domain-containing protein [Candidatus Sericytochromatia bacterium]|nr:lipocalin-like domain-containing protein [Candidatus Sericytochromatia bacterium]
MLRRLTSLAILALTLGACASGARPGTSLPTGAGAAALSTPADPAGLDMATYVRLTTGLLAEALRTGDAATVRLFTAYAEGHDPQPEASRAIAQAALAATPVAATDDAGLRASVARIAAGAPRVRPAAEPTAIAFPADEGDHPHALTEWWYLNGHLETRGVGPLKRRFGYEFTLFKAGALLHWAHVAVTDVTFKRFRYTREFIPAKQAQGAIGRLAQAYGTHALEAVGPSVYKLSSGFGDSGLDLRLASRKAPLLIGGNGKIDMPEGKDSWYYSQTRLAATGAVVVGGERKEVTGVSWLDHQWGPFFVSGFADRWDWFALQFEDGTEYNLFGFRSASGQAGARHVNRSGSDGRGTTGSRFTMERLDWWRSPQTGLYYTTDWRISLPDSGETVELEALVRHQEVARRKAFVLDPLPSYWEGAMSAVKRTPDGKAVKGRAYCEHFGFKSPAGPR